jgi:hypothetical protein
VQWYHFYINKYLSWRPCGQYFTHLHHIINVQKCEGLKHKKRNARAIYIQDWYGIICNFRTKKKFLCTNRASFLELIACFMQPSSTDVLICLVIFLNQNTSIICSTKNIWECINIISENLEVFFNYVGPFLTFHRKKVILMQFLQKSMELDTYTMLQNHCAMYQLYKAIYLFIQPIVQRKVYPSLCLGNISWARERCKGILTNMKCWFPPTMLCWK